MILVFLVLQSLLARIEQAGIEELLFLEVTKIYGLQTVMAEVGFSSI